MLFRSVDVNNKMRIAQEEIFGPVLVVIPFENDDDAVRIANDSEYGLSGAVQSGDQDHAFRVASRIRTGMVHLNGAPPDQAAPFGGYKKSGIGRETHKMMLDHYQQTKNVLVSYSPKAMGFF